MLLQAVPCPLNQGGLYHSAASLSGVQSTRVFYDQDSLFAFLALGMMPVPWVFFKYGHLLRKRSRYVPVVVAEEGESK